MHAALSASFPSDRGIKLVAAECGGDNVWFGADDRLIVDHHWFDDRQYVRSATPCPAKIAESLVPFTEDCRRAVKQVVQSLGDVKQNELIVSGVARLFPGLPLEAIHLTHSLYMSVVEKQNIDILLLNTLGMVSTSLLHEGNAISRLANFVQQTLLDYTGKSYFSQFLQQDENHPSHFIYLALGLLAISTRYWMTQEAAPQRRLLHIPAFFANLLLRVSVYWQSLSRMAQNVGEISPIPPNRLTACSSAVKIVNSDAVLPLVAGTTVTTALSTPRSDMRSRVLMGAVGSVVGSALVGGVRLIYNACVVRRDASTQEPEATRVQNRHARATPLDSHAATKTCHEINLKTLSPSGLRGFKLVSDMHGSTQPVTYRHLNACLLAYFESVNDINCLVFELPKVNDDCNALNIFLKRKIPPHNARIRFSVRINAYHRETLFFTLTDEDGNTTVALGRVNNAYFMDIHEGVEKVRLTDATLPLEARRFINMDVAITQHERGWRVNVKRYGKTIFSSVLKQKPRFSSLGIGSNTPLKRYRRTMEIRSLQVKALRPMN